MIFAIRGADNEKKGRKGSLFTRRSSPLCVDMRKFLSFFFVCAILPIAHTSCPDGFELAVDGQCNKLVGSEIELPYNKATETAISKCKELKAQPIIIHNEEQQSYWTGKWKSGAGVILGIVCNTATSKWEWSDGSTVDYKPAPGNYNTDLDRNCKTGCTWYMSFNNGVWYSSCGSSSYNFDIYCTTQLPPLPVPSADGCDSFEDDSEDGVCYQVGKTAESWQEAQKICRNLGADLASIHNQQENSFIRRLAVSRGVVNGVFLGATVSGKGNQFGWIDGSDWDYQNFYAGFPINGLGDCVAMDTQSISGEWVNTGCNANFSVACIRQQSQPACHVEKWTEGQVIVSPGFPYNASIPCDFMLMVDAGKKVELEVVMLEANSCCDHLIIFENSIGNNVIANLTGEITDKKYTTTSSNFMRVSWQPNGGVNVRGMMMTFRAV